MTERAIIRNPWEADRHERYQNWLEGGLRRDELMIREGFEPTRGVVVSGFSRSAARCQGFMADGESQCKNRGVVRGERDLMFCKRHGPPRELRTTNLMWATSGRANNRDARLHICSIDPDEEWLTRHGDALCGGIAPDRVGEHPFVRPLSSQDEANSINLDLTRGIVHKRICERCFDIAKQHGLVEQVSVEHTEQTEARWLAEAATRLLRNQRYGRNKDRQPNIETDDVLWAADRIADQDPDLAAALRRAERIFREKITELHATMVPEDWEDDDDDWP